MQAKPAVICLYGPTASGKTDLAVELARRLPLQIVSVDSALVYRGMDIGTAKPDAATLRQAPHRLIDILDPAEAYSAARFCDDALREIEDIHAQGGIPLLVGGTMLYFRALFEGLSELPPADAGIRARLEAEAAEQGWAHLHARLNRADPQAAGRIHANDPQRIQRALEVFELTGQPLSTLQRGGGAALAERFAVLRVGLMFADRSVLHERIARRFGLMLDQGLLEEVARLKARGDLHTGLPSMRCVGYRQAWDYLDGQCTYAQMLDKAQAATRQLAKRQITWMRSTAADLMLDPLGLSMQQQSCQIEEQFALLLASPCKQQEAKA